MENDCMPEGTSILPFSRLGDCEVCGNHFSKYTCPECEVKTCSLPCVQIHKKELECSGIRNRVKFKRLKTFTNLDLLSDYRLLEETNREVENVKKNGRFLPKQRLERFLFRLRFAARKHEIKLLHLPTGFSRRKHNTTTVNWKSNTILWKIDWVFVDADNLNYSESRVPDTTLMSDVVNKFLSPDSCPEPLKNRLSVYRENEFRVILRAEKITGKKFYMLKPSETLRENLRYKVIVENPVLYVVLANRIFDFEFVYIVAQPKGQPKNLLEYWECDDDDDENNKDGET